MNSPSMMAVAALAGVIWDPPGAADLASTGIAMHAGIHSECDRGAWDGYDFYHSLSESAAGIRLTVEAELHEGWADRSQLSTANARVLFMGQVFYPDCSPTCVDSHAGVLVSAPDRTQVEDLAFSRVFEFRRPEGGLVPPGRYILSAAFYADVMQLGAGPAGAGFQGRITRVGIETIGG